MDPSAQWLLTSSNRYGKNTVNFGFMGVEQVFSQYNYYSNSLTFNGNFTAGPNPLAGTRVSAHRQRSG